MKVKKLSLLAMPLVLAAALTGCHQGPNANTTVQDETGSGILLHAGYMQVASAVIVAGEAGDERGSVTAVIVNNGSQADELRSITVNGQPATIDPAGPEIGPRGSVSVRTGGDVTAVAPLAGTPAGDFVEVSFRFADSGEAAGQLLIVPPVGFYESAAPEPGGASEQSSTEASPTVDEGPAVEPEGP